MRKVRKKKKTPLLSRPTDKHPRLSDRQRNLLGSLAALDGWIRPMDVGARDGSHHAATLSGLARRGLVDRKKIHAIYCYNGSTHRQKLVDNRWIVSCRGGCRYRITLAAATGSRSPGAGRRAVGQ